MKLNMNIILLYLYVERNTKKNIKTMYSFKIQKETERERVKKINAASLVNSLWCKLCAKSKTTNEQQKKNNNRSTALLL